MAMNPYQHITLKDELETVISLLLMANRGGFQDATSKSKQINHLRRLLRSVVSITFAKDRDNPKSKLSSVQSGEKVNTRQKRFEVHKAQINTPRAGNTSSTYYRSPSTKGTKRKMEAQLSEPSSFQETSFRTYFDLLDAAVKQLQLEVSLLRAKKYQFDVSAKLASESNVQ
eukprot:jgi/Bigna1/133847/aug1.22_g8555